jgi:hypothetical protein
MTHADESAHRQYFSEEDIERATEEYEEEYEEVMEADGLEVVVSRNFEGQTDRIIGFRLSLDSDDGLHGYDRRFGEW